MLSWIFGSSTSSTSASTGTSDMVNDSGAGKHSDPEIIENPLVPRVNVPRFTVNYNQENYRNIQAKLNRLPFKFNPSKLWLLLCSNDYCNMCFFITDLDYQFMDYFRNLADGKNDYFYNENYELNDLMENMYFTDNPIKFESFIHLFDCGNELYKGMVQSGQGLADMLSELYCDNKDMDREYKRCFQLCDEIYNKIYEQQDGKCTFSL